MRKPTIIIFAIIFLSFIISIYLYPNLPEQIASHWNFAGEVDAYMPKIFLFLIPLISLALIPIFIYLPKICPLKKNIEKFRKFYDMFIIAIFVFFFYLHMLTMLWNFFQFSMIQALIPAFAILFYCTGILLENSKRNWFIGIKTPWTLSSEKVWDKTHKLGGKLFKISGVISLVGIFFPNYALFFILIPAILISIYAVIYSYLEYNK